MTENSRQEIFQYNKKQTKEYSKICELLMEEIDKALKNSTAKVWHGSPVWFIDGNPIVGYNVAKESLELMFWSGQSFDEPQLIPAGKSKAAKIKYQEVKDVDIKLLREWLEKSKKIMWNYKDIIKNKGKLTELKTSK